VHLPARSLVVRASQAGCTFMPTSQASGPVRPASRACGGTGL
jgi:hypothetical protein